LYAVIFGLLFIGCTKDNAEDNVLVFAYASDSLEVSFRTQGTIPAPTIEWPGEPGTFTFKNEIPGLQLDESTGAIQWERNLDIGDHQVEVIAQNDQQTLETHFLLSNVLGASFWVGGHNNDTESEDIEIDRAFTFSSDGTLEVELFDAMDTQGIGVWEINGDTIEIRFCTSCNDIDPDSVPEYDEHSFYQGTLVNEEAVAFIRGQRSVVRFDPDSTTPRGNFYMEWD